MSSNQSSSGKSLTSTSNPIQAQAGPAPSGLESSRRPVPSNSSPSHATPRKNQAARKQHKNQRRPALADSRQHASPDEDDAMAEIRALRNASSRRGQTSITHLLNYSAPSRQYQDYHHSHPRSYRRNPTWGPGSGHHAADKARYVHANYRFVVSPDGNYNTQAADANQHLQWGDVLQVLASAESQATSCPICLSEPVAPRMARCGHIFCLPCLIRFMSSANGDDHRPNRGARWQKCPICEDAISLHETRPVRFYAGQESPLPRIGDDVVLRLMARTATSTLALPWEGGSDVLSIGDDIPWHFAANVMDYARIIKGTREYMNAQHDEEIEQLEKQEMEDQVLYQQDNEWTQKAIKAINAAREKIKDLESVSNAAPGGPSTGKPVRPDFYFYASQPHLYLSALDIRILKTKYGDFSSFPSTLLPRVEHISTGHVLDEAQRKRAKYLGHLPYGCVITFLECDWTDIVPPEILEKFAGEIERRRKRNYDKAAQEDRERLQAERLEAAAIRSSAGTTRRYPIEEDRVPALNSEDFQPLTSHSSATPPDPRPGFAHLASVSTSPSAQRTVWGTPAIAASPELAPVQRAPSNDGWLRDEDVFGFPDLPFEMEALGIEGSSNGEASSAAVGGNGKGKKKKKQKITLMSTGGRRGN